MSFQSGLEPHREFILKRLSEGESKAGIARSLKVPVTTLKNYIDGLSRGSTTPTIRVVPEPAVVDTTEILQARVRELEGLLKRDRKSVVAEERIIRAVEESVHVAKPGKPPAKPVLSRDSDEPHHRAVLLLSDFHGGEIVDPVAVNGLNAYSWQIMEQRVTELLTGVESHAKHSPALTGIDCIFIGDMCSGSNHQELAETNEYALAEQGIRMGYLQGQILEHLASRFTDVRSLVVVGNHPRLSKKPAAKRVHDNMDWVAGLVAKQYVSAQANVTVNVPSSAAAFWDIAGMRFYVSHGDGVRSTMPGVPWGGLSRRWNEILRTYGPMAGWWCGHFHTPNVMGNGIVMNGSLKGLDEWCLKNFGGGIKPTQLLLLFDEKRGRRTAVKEITPEAGL